MNDNRPCTGFCNERSYCVFLNGEFDECFNNEVYQKRSKLENTLVDKCHKKFKGSVEEWQALLDRIYREVCETYPCRYNVNKNEVVKLIDDNDGVK
ncbi:MAG: hypothetical protein WC877_00375 [Dehalococcoidales bacterium]